MRILRDILPRPPPQLRPSPGRSHLVATPHPLSTPRTGQPTCSGPQCLRGWAWRDPERLARGARGCDGREDVEAEVNKYLRQRSVGTRAWHAGARAGREHHGLGEVGDGAGDIVHRLAAFLAQVVLGVVRAEGAAEEDGHEARAAQAIGDDEGEVGEGEDERHLGVGVRAADHVLGHEGCDNAEGDSDEQREQRNLDPPRRTKR